LSDKEHLLNICLVAYDNFAWNVDPAEHVNDQIVGESSLAFFKEVVERLFKVSECSSALDEFSLHLWSNLLVKLEFFNHQVEVIQECLLNVFSNVVVKSRLNMVWLV